MWFSIKSKPYCRHAIPIYIQSMGFYSETMSIYTASMSVYSRLMRFYIESEPSYSRSKASCNSSKLFCSQSTTNNISSSSVFNCSKSSFFICFSIHDSQSSGSAILPPFGGIRRGLSLPSLSPARASLAELVEADRPEKVWSFTKKQ